MRNRFFIFILITCIFSTVWLSQSISPVYALTCPPNVLCFDTPLYTSSIGTWYLIWDWQNVGVPGGKGWLDMAIFKPQLGYYTADDTYTFDTHSKLLSDAKINFLIMDATNGLGAVKVSQNALKLKTYLESKSGVNNPQLAVAIGTCTWAYAPQWTLSDRINCQNNESNWIHQNLAQSSTYFKLNDKPLLINFTTAQNKLLPSSWETDPFLNWNDPRFHVGLSSGTNSDFKDISRKKTGGIWGWVPDEVVSNTTAMQIGPGWDRTKFEPAGDVKPILRNKGETLMDQFLLAIAVNPKIIVVGGFNDFTEEQWWEPALLDPAAKLIIDWKTTYSVLKKEDWKALDPYGTEVADWYYQIVRAYSYLRYGLLENSCYREVDKLAVYCVYNGKLQYQGVMPRGKPVIKIPPNTFSKVVYSLLGDLNGDSHVNIFDYNILVAGFGNPYTIFDYNTLVANYGK